MKKIVHLDMKGFPLRVMFLERVIKTAKLWGATGILFEWEDTFPYGLELSEIGSQACDEYNPFYGIDEVRHLLNFTKECGLEPIQLIQTIGHMEFVLKHPAFRDLRESYNSPAVLCPSQEESQALVREMLGQALALQPDAKYVHIGADEVWHTGLCKECQIRAATDENKTASLFLNHVQGLAQYLKEQYPQLTVLMWDDMLRTLDANVLNSYKLGELVQPIVWQYSTVECFQFEPGMWKTYQAVFPSVWAGSAFKGANGSCQVVAPASRYASNQEAWLGEMKKYQGQIKFEGVVLTGWSRYDHYATLCELLPVALPSLASCLRVLRKTEQESVASLVSCSLPLEQWEGASVARSQHAFVLLRDRCIAFIHSDLVNTWMNPWQLENNYTNPIQIEGIVVTARLLLKELTALETDLSVQFESITDARSKEEWLGTFVSPIIKRLKELLASAEVRCHAGPSVLPGREKKAL